MKKYICLLLLFLSVGITKAQPEERNDIVNYSPLQNYQAPDVATFNTYGSIPVSLYTGTPDVSIPLYTIKEEGIEIPIRVSYNINNVKPNTRPGVVGLGWNLFAGGNITRIQKGLYDDCYIQNGKWGFLGEEFRLSDNWAKDVSDQSMKEEPWYSVKRLYWEQKQELWKDWRKEYTPDKFIFNFLGYNGAFYRDHTGKWVVDSETSFTVDHQLISFKNARDSIAAAVEKVYGGGLIDIPFLSKFTLKAPDGMVFEFGGKEAIDYSVGYFFQADRNNPPIATTWHLSKIILPNGKTITFDYVPTDCVLAGDFNFWIQSNLTDKRNGRGLNFQLILPVLLKSIKLPNSDKVMEFEYATSRQLEYARTYFKDWDQPGCCSYITLDYTAQESEQVWIYEKASMPYPDWSQLSKIKIIDGSEYLFDYTNSEKERLKLKSVSKKSNKESLSENHYFYYNSTKLPDYLSGHYDHLGFYNGGDFSFTFKSSFYFSVYDKDLEKIRSNADKYYQMRGGDHSGKFVCAEMLEKIEYPTGGHSTFEYEPNFSADAVTPDRRSVILNPPSAYTGGLRIKKITSYGDKNKFVNAKRYHYVTDFVEYGEEGRPSGILAFTPKYFWDLYLSTVAPLNNNHFDPIKHTDYMRILTSGSTSQAYYNLEGSAYVGYSEVVECSEDINGNIEGYTKYTYSNFGEGYFDDWPLATLNNFNEHGLALSPRTPFVSNAKKRGKLLTKEVYDKNNHLQHGTYNKYASTPSKEVRSIDLFFLPDYGGRLFSAFSLGGSYVRKLYEYLPSERIEKTVVGSDTIKEITQYEYNAGNKILKTTKRINGAESLVNTTKYTGDFLRDNYNYDSPLLNTMKFLHMFDYPVETTVSRNGKVISSEVFDYDFPYGGSPLLSTKYQLETNEPISNYQGVKFGKTIEIDPRCKPLVSLNTHNQYASVNYLQTNTSKAVYLSSYNGLHAIAEIQNATVEEVLLAMQENMSYINELTKRKEPTESDWIKINSLRQVLPYSLVTTYVYKPYVGVSSVTNPRGMTTYYDYDGFGRLKETYIMEKGVKKVLQGYHYNYRNK